MRFEMKLLLILIVAVAAASTDLIAPALHTISQDTGAAYANVQLMLSAFTVSYGVSLLAIAPLCERFGRALVLASGLAVLAAASFASALTQDIWMLIALRIVQGMAAAVGPVIARSLARDLFENDQLKAVMSDISIASAVVPLAAPLGGALLLSMWGWKSLFIGLGLLCTCVFGFAVLRHNAIMKLGGAVQDATQAISFRSKLGFLFSDRHFRTGTTLISISYALIFVFVSLSSELFRGVLEITQSGYALVYSLAIASFILGSWLARHIDSLSWFLPSVLFCCGALSMLCSAAGIAPIAAAVLGVAFLNIGAGVLTPSGQFLLLKKSKHLASYAAAFSSFFQLTTAAFVSSLATILAAYVGYQLILAGCLLVSLLPFITSIRTLGKAPAQAK